MIPLLQAKGVTAIACRVSPDGRSLNVGILLIQSDHHYPAHPVLRNRDNASESFTTFLHPSLKAGVYYKHDLDIYEPCPF